MDVREKGPVRRFFFSRQWTGTLSLSVHGTHKNEKVSQMGEKTLRKYM